MYNQDKDRRGGKCSYDVKKLVLTLNFYSLCAYEYIRGVFFFVACQLIDWKELLHKL